ncbi:hypothetical protein BpHYR1_023545 [Brachionus plicatilis]|uniref:Uncharacterized protein n=1 Tax=Brachionus plicatilis TaxID=10195 RepID=A0A3M7RSY1_BRAPC|nr:hypothetical protein BpHYR1_023545 [Brachionus plicatilis]
MHSFLNKSISRYLKQTLLIRLFELSQRYVGAGLSNSVTKVLQLNKINNSYSRLTAEQCYI